MPGPPGLSATNGLAPAALRARSTQRSVSGWVVTAFSGAAARSRLTLTAMRSPGVTSAPQPPKGATARSTAAGEPVAVIRLGDVRDEAGHQAGFSATMAR